MNADVPRAQPGNGVFRPCVLMPTYNNDRTLLAVMERATGLGLPLVVVNDGSTDRTAVLLDEWSRGPHGQATTIVTHPRNRGKAAALLTGFAAAARLGFTHAATLDTDGQLDPAEIPGLLRESAAAPDALVLGVRTDPRDGCPGPSNFGRWMSNLMIKGECGLEVTDSQCGLRVYPLQLVELVHCWTGRYSYEAEMIARARWAGAPVIQSPVTCHYPPAAERVSHFRPVIDSLRGIALHAVMLTRAVMPWPHRVYWRSGPLPVAPIGGRLKRFIRWINPVRAWRELQSTALSRPLLAAGLAVGVFIANLPCYGLHTLLSLYLARRLSLHPASVVAGSMISTPPLGPVLIAAAIYVGGLLLHGSPPNLVASFHHNGAWSLPPLSLLADWLAGSIVVGFLCMAITFFAALGLLRSVPAPAPNDGAVA